MEKLNFAISSVMEMLMENKNSNFAYLQFKLGQEAWWENYFFKWSTVRITWFDKQPVFSCGALNNIRGVNQVVFSLMVDEVICHLGNSMRKQKSCCNHVDPFIFYILILLIRDEGDSFERHSQSAKFVLSARIWVFDKCMVDFRRWELINVALRFQTNAIWKFMIARGFDL